MTATLNSQRSGRRARSAAPAGGAEAKAPDGRGRRRSAAMRRVQSAALELIAAHGYDAVTIEAIAAAADSSPASVYRHFGSKERIILWDEYDPLLFEALRARLAHEAPLAAVQAALGSALARVYASDRARILRRGLLAESHPALVAASAAEQAALRHGLAAELERAAPVPNRLAARVTAYALAGAIEAAAREWIAMRGKRPLQRLLDEAFAHLCALVGAPVQASRPRTGPERARAKTHSPAAHQQRPARVPGENSTSKRELAAK